MKVSKLKNKKMRLYKWMSILAFFGCVVPILADDAAQETTTRAQILVSDSIKGQVIDAVTQLPLAGAQIRTNDQRYSAMTGDDGTFVLRLSPFVRVMTVFAPGYEPKESPIFKSEKHKKIAIAPLVFGGYYENEIGEFGTRRKAAVTTSMRSFIVDNKSSVSVDSELRKKAAGDVLLSTYSGSPVVGANMRIRGINSLNTNTQALVVIDGVIIDNQSDRASLHLGNFVNPLSGIDVSDIRSVSVLKDATTMYGSKGGNGVILINTNRGRSMATEITVTGMLGYNQRPTSIPMLNADQYRIYLSDMLKNPVADKALSNKFFLNNDPTFIFYNKFHNTTDWADGIYRNGNTQSYNVAVNGGDEIALYNLSIGMTNALSTLQSNDFNRINARFNSDISLTPNFNTAFDISYLQISRKLRNDGIAEDYTSQINSPGFLSLVKSPFLTPFQYSNTRQLTTKLDTYDFMGIANPNAILEYGTGHSQHTQFNLALVPTYYLSKTITLSSRFSYSLVSLSENMFSPMYGVAPYINPDNAMVSNNHVKTQFARQNSIFNDTRLNWKKINDNHSFELNGGLRYIYESYKAEYAEGHNTGTDQIREMSRQLMYRLVDGIDEPTKHLSYYGVFNYGLKEKYFLETALAFETSSRFGTNPTNGIHMLGVGWATFPSVNAAWLVSSEEFMKNAGFINMLKLRAGIGQSGNDGISNTAAHTYFGAVTHSTNATGVNLVSIANPNIQWETVTKRNVGVDAVLLNDRLSLYADYYTNTTDNLLVTKQLDPYSGIGFYWTNDGSLQNKGFEAGFDARLIQTNDFSFTLGASVAANANEITALADKDYLTKVYGAEVLTAVGKPFGQFYGYQTNGVYATTDAATDDGLLMRTSTGALVPFEAGDIRFVDTYKDGIIDDLDKTVIGNSNPDFFGGLHAGVRYKKLTLNVVFNYSYGNDIYNYLRSQLEGGANFYNQALSMANRWISEGHQTSTPKAVYGDPKGNSRFSDRWIEDGSYLRLKTIELSYKLPMNKVDFLQGVTLWASANNLFTFTNYLGLDPDFSQGRNLMYQGIDTGMLPQSQSFFAGFKVYL